MKLEDAHQQWLKDPTPTNRDQLGESLYHFTKAIIASQFGPQYSLLEDAIGESCLKVLAGLSDSELQIKNVTTWAYVVTYNTCLDMLRAKSRREEERLCENMHPHFEPGYIEHLTLESLCEKLSPQEQALFNYKIDGLANEAIAERLDVTENVVRHKWEDVNLKLRTLVGGG